MSSLLPRLLDRLHYELSWSVRSWFQDNNAPAFQAHYQRACADVLAACAAADLTVFAIEGTLIGLLRYGRNGLPGVQPWVDDDVDLMSVTATPDEWITKSAAVRTTLLARGWTDSMRRTSWMSTADQPGTRTDKLKLRLFSGHPRIWTHLDLHNCVSPPDGTHLISHDLPDAYPFQTWQGRLPRDLVFPLRQARCYAQTAPVPQQPLTILRGWNGGEYAQGNLLYPRQPLDPAQRQAVIDSVRALDAAGHASFAELLPDA